MKLIREEINDVNFLREEKDGKKDYFIEGVFMQSNVKNKNGRIYPKNVSVNVMFPNILQFFFIRII